MIIKINFRGRMSLYHWGTETISKPNNNSIWVIFISPSFKNRGLNLGLFIGF